ncbi:MAG: YihY/virulence factor BrkB family protein [Bacteroidota bacterium]
MKKLNLKDRVHESSLVGRLRILTQRIILPGFGKAPLYDVGKFFFNGVQNSSLSMRASAVAFNFFLAIFPAIIFLFTLIPYIPIHGFQKELMGMLADIMPEKTFEASKGVFNDILTRGRGGLLSLGFVLAFVFASNGIISLIRAFDATYHEIGRGSNFKRRMYSLLLVLIQAILVIGCISLLAYFEVILKRLVHSGYHRGGFAGTSLTTAKWLLIVIFSYLGIAFLYFFGPSGKVRWKFISAGATLATILSLATSAGFNYYVSRFATYNALYGSIGTLIIILLWMYINALVLLIGFELNASIYSAKKK